MLPDRQAMDGRAFRTIQGRGATAESQGDHAEDAGAAGGAPRPRHDKPHEAFGKNASGTGRLLAEELANGELEPDDAARAG
jgi:hypothetical protein